MAEEISVKIAYALAEQQMVLELNVAAGCTVESAIRASGIIERFPEIDLRQNQVGIFGEVCPLDRPLDPGDRVEIYRPLLHDPKQARRIRAQKARK